MIRAIRPSAMAQDDISLVNGWNVAPNVGYTVVLTPGPSACGVLLFDADMTVLVASGAGLVGTDQPVILLPQTGQTIGMVDADLGWHLLLTTTGTEAQQTIRIGPAVDLPDEIHPIYTDDNMALARATAAINAGASYVDDVTVACPLGIGAGIGAVASAPVDGSAVVGQVESVTWSGTPDGTSETAMIRRHTPIAPEAYTPPPTPPVLADDTADTDAATATSGNVLANDESDLTVVAVNGLASNIGQVVSGSNGGEFVISADGAWTFGPAGDFAELSGTDTAQTSVTYHASDGVSEASATLTVTVSSADQQPWTLAEVTSAQWLDYADASTLTWAGSNLSAFADKSGNNRHATQSSDANRPYNSGVLLYFADSRYMIQNVPQSLPCHVFWVIDLAQVQASAPYSILNRYAVSPPYPPGVYISGQAERMPALYWDGGWTGQYPSQVSKAIMLLELIMTPTQGGFRVNGGAAQLRAHSNSAKSHWNSFPSDYLPQAARHGMAERLIVNAAVDDALRYKIEGCLTHKWDALLGVTTLVDGLPLGHPYKSAAPTI